MQPAQRFAGEVALGLKGLDAGLQVGIKFRHAFFNGGVETLEARVLVGDFALKGSAPGGDLGILVGPLCHQSREDRRDPLW
ncbi:hypothetical protein [Devosia sp.]|uniref:hypothetical protein n=1 Tax=Devosia sp. TaxID=1871048 RepID=UPI0035AD7B82